MALLIYVDNVILAANNLHDIAAVKRYLHESFTIKDFSQLKFFLGIKVTRSAKSI